MNELKYIRVYRKHCDVAQMVLKKEGREKLQWIHDQIAYQVRNYRAASDPLNRTPQSGGFLARLARGGSASKLEKLEPKLQAYADVLKSDAEAFAQVDEIFALARNSWAYCPHCEAQYWKEVPKDHIDNCEHR